MKIEPETRPPIPESLKGMMDGWTALGWDEDAVSIYTLQKSRELTAFVTSCLWPAFKGTTVFGVDHDGNLYACHREGFILKMSWSERCFGEQTAVVTEKVADNFEEFVDLKERRDRPTV